VRFLHFGFRGAAGNADVIGFRFHRKSAVRLLGQIERAHAQRARLHLSREAKLITGRGQAGANLGARRYQFPCVCCGAVERLDMLVPLADQVRDANSRIRAKLA
jgi:hypothetical protein